MLDLTKYTGHTPGLRGRWYYDDGITDDATEPPERGKPSMVEVPGTLIASIWGPEGKATPRTWAESDANGRLMADAPLLLAEVVQLRQECERLREWQASIMRALPVGNIATHTPDTAVARITDYLHELCLVSDRAEQMEAALAGLLKYHPDDPDLDAWWVDNYLAAVEAAEKLLKPATEGGTE